MDRSQLASAKWVILLTIMVSLTITSVISSRSSNRPCTICHTDRHSAQGVVRDILDRLLNEARVQLLAQPSVTADFNDKQPAHVSCCNSNSFWYF